MDLEIIEIKNVKIARLTSEGEVINNVEDALDLIGNADCQGARSIILDEKNLNPDFFDLKTGVAGEILLKFSNYHMKLAVIGEFEKYNSNALNAFITECNRGRTTFFTPDFETAVEKLVKAG